MALVVLGPQLASAMLPAGMPQLQQLQRLFGIVAVGHVLQLLGCFLWPARAAKLGRKGLQAWTLGLSGFCTALCGCMPSYSEVRVAAGDTGVRCMVLLLRSLAQQHCAPKANVTQMRHPEQHACGLLSSAG
jgi:MFS family permease